MAVWEFALEALKENRKVALLVVLHSQGSSPGRQGFKMVLSETGQMAGSIGGGIMEHKLVELARNLLPVSPDQPILKRQIHSKAAIQNQSGMICSGEQTVALYFLKPFQVPVLESITAALKGHKSGLLLLSDQGLDFLEGRNQETTFTFSVEKDTVWHFSEKIPARKAVYIIGGGHVALALSQVLRMLPFDLHLFDDRPNLNTFTDNPFVHFKTITPYAQIADLIPEGPENFVVIMTIGYRSDKEVIRQLLGRNYGYLGLLGSKAKIAQLFAELKDEGFSETELKKVYAPIGIQIKSQTPEEIAISIAAEIIQVKNK